jgi:hypothetical protein
MPKDLPGTIEAFCKRAAAAGCKDVSADTENWMITAGPRFLMLLHESAKRHGLTVWIVPAISYNHFLVSKESDDWAWTRTDKGRAGLTVQQCGEVFKKYTDGSLQWYYGSNPQAFVASRFYVESIGDTNPYIPMIDGTERLSDSVRADMVGKLYEEFGGIGLFNPRGYGAAMVEALRKAKTKE